MPVRLKHLQIVLRAFDKYGKLCRSWQQLVQQSEALGTKQPVHVVDASKVATRPIETRDQSKLDRVPTSAENNRDRRGRGFGGLRRIAAAARCGDDGCLAAHEVCRQFR